MASFGDQINALEVSTRNQRQISISRDDGFCLLGNITVDLEEACEVVGGEVMVEAGLDGEVEQEALIPLSRRPCMLIHLGSVKP